MLRSSKTSALLVLVGLVAAVASTLPAEGWPTYSPTQDYPTYSPTSSAGSPADALASSQTEAMPEDTACQLPNGGGLGVAVRVDFDFDLHPEDISWTLSNSCYGGEILVFFGGNYADQSSITEMHCVPDGTFVFNVIDLYDDGMCCSEGLGDYTVSKSGVEMISMEDGTNFGSGETKSFGSSEDCACEIPNGGGRGVLVQVDFAFDDYPEDISWALYNTCDGGDVVAVGGDYEFDISRPPFAGSYCVPDGTFSFVVRDSNGDGICCALGFGDYTVSKNGVEMISMEDGTNFGMGESKLFGSAADCDEMV